MVLTVMMPGLTPVIPDAFKERLDAEEVGKMDACSWLSAGFTAMCGANSLSRGKDEIGSGGASSGSTGVGRKKAMGGDVDESDRSVGVDSSPNPPITDMVRIRLVANTS